MHKPTIYKKKWAYHYGRIGEYIALFYLYLKGYRLIQHNFLCAVGQIDLIMTRGDTLIFIEVKARQHINAFEGAISYTQRIHLKKAANFFLSKNPKFLSKNSRFDAIFLVNYIFITHYQNFLEDMT